MILRVLALAAALTRASAFEDIKCKWLNSKGCQRVSYCELKGDKCTDAPQAMVTCADGDEIPDDCLGLGKVACKKLKKKKKCKFSKATKVCARKGGALSCATVAGYSAKKREKECAKSTTLAACPAACGTCVPPCAFEDSETWQWKKQTCATMAKKKKKTKLHKACNKKDKATKIRGHTACPLACGRCFEETPAPTDAPTPKPSATPTPPPTSAPTFDDAEGWTATGAVNGVAPGSTVIVTLGSAVDDSFLATRELAGGGAFEFQDLNKSHDYFLKWEGIGYKSEEATVLSYASSGRRRLGDAATPIVYDAEYAFPGATEDGVFHFSWTADASRGGSTEYANVPNVTLEILGEAVETINDHAAGKLEHKYGIVLSNDGDRAWSTEQSFRLLQTLDSIPQRNPRDVYAPQNQPLSRWSLVDEYLDNDIDVVKGSGAERAVRVTAAAFTHATPMTARLDGVRGAFFSKRLHHACVRFVTDGGTDVAAVEKIFEDRYGSTIAVSDAEYVALTAPTTGETAAAFQPFTKHVEEPLAMLSMFEELPSGFHKVQGLGYLLRRADGYNHPRYVDAAAVAWPTAHESSYIEFMEKAFGADLPDTQRLILHEKAHFMWENVFSEELRQNWTALGGWYFDADEGEEGEWKTTESTTFVSPYAHGHNPNEDMAETIGFYVMYPDKILSCCPEKFAFVRDRIMSGYRYVTMLRDDLTFEVLNLWPDYSYPGKIVQVNITVEGAPEDDKEVTVSMKLQTGHGIFEGAEYAYARIHSEIGTYFDRYFYNPMVNGEKDRSIVQATWTISKYSKSGYWAPKQISLKDLNGNQRFAGTDDYGWRLHVDNPLEDLEKPRYVANSMKTTVVAGVEVDGADVSHDVHYVTCEWLVTDDGFLDDWGGVYVRLISEGGAFVQGTSGLQEYGYPGTELLEDTVGGATASCGPDAMRRCYRATITQMLTEFRVAANYGASFVSLKDQAGNQGGETFNADNDEDVSWVYVNISAATADSTAPEIDVNDIDITAEPTNPDAPNGETKVTIVYRARDDLSGLGTVSYRLLDPLGKSFFEYHYHKHFYSTFFEGDPTAWADYTINVVLPAGSAPGTWGLESMSLSDKVNNVNNQDFTETGHFETVGEGRRLEAKRSAKHTFEVL